MSLVTRRATIILVTFAGTILLLISTRNGGTTTPRAARTQLDRFLLGFTGEGGGGEKVPQAGIVPKGHFPKVSGDNRVTWSGANDLPQTNIVRHVTGWTVLDTLYAHNGTFYIISDQPPDDFPPIREMISSGWPMYNGKEDVERREPTGRDMQVITPRKAVGLFGKGASRISGVSFVSNDPDQFVGHYYHFCAEIFFGLWRTYSSLDENISPSGDSYLPAPSRLIFPHLPHGRWRDEAKMNHIVLRSAFPSMSIETQQSWLDRASTDQLYLLDVVVLTERTAAVRGEGYEEDDKMVSMATRLPGSRHWWAPVRNNVLEFAGMSRGKTGTIEREHGKHVITYIVRQGRGRAMETMSHRALVESLRALEKAYGWELNIVMLERLKKTEQLKLIARTTILIGVHGNGLTSVLWMLPSPRSTVIEIFHPGGFTSDYQVPAKALNIEHYSVWNDTFIRSDSPSKPPRAQPDGFHEHNIPCHGPTVAALVEERLLDPRKLTAKMNWTETHLPESTESEAKGQAALQERNTQEEGTDLRDDDDDEGQGGEPVEDTSNMNVFGDRAEVMA